MDQVWSVMKIAAHHSAQSCCRNISLYMPSVTPESTTIVRVFSKPRKKSPCVSSQLMSSAGTLPPNIHTHTHTPPNFIFVSLYSRYYYAWFTLFNNIYNHFAWTKKKKHCWIKRNVIYRKKHDPQCKDDFWFCWFCLCLFFSVFCHDFIHFHFIQRFCYIFCSIGSLITRF